MEDPQVTMGFNTKSWMMWGFDFRKPPNFHISICSPILLTGLGVQGSRRYFWWHQPALCWRLGRGQAPGKGRAQDPALFHGNSATWSASTVGFMLEENSEKLDGWISMELFLFSPVLFYFHFIKQWYPPEPADWSLPYPSAAQEWCEGYHPAGGTGWGLSRLWVWRVAHPHQRRAVYLGL